MNIETLIDKDMIKERFEFLNKVGKRNLYRKGNDRYLLEELQEGYKIISYHLNFYKVA